MILKNSSEQTNKIFDEPLKKVSQSHKLLGFSNIFLHQLNNENEREYFLISHIPYS